MTSNIKAKGSRATFRRSFIRAGGSRVACRRGPGYSRRLVLSAVLGKTIQKGSEPTSNEPFSEERKPVTYSSIEREILAIFTALGWSR